MLYTRQQTDDNIKKETNDWNTKKLTHKMKESEKAEKKCNLLKFLFKKKCTLGAREKKSMVGTFRRERKRDGEQAWKREREKKPYNESLFYAQCGDRTKNNVLFSLVHRTQVAKHFMHAATYKIVE